MPGSGCPTAVALVGGLLTGNKVLDIGIPACAKGLQVAIGDVKAQSGSRMTLPRDLLRDVRRADGRALR
jgi:hypothetical protein